MASKARQILEAMKTALESIDGTGSYNFNVPAERIQYRALDKSGNAVKGNVLGPRPCIVIWVQAPDAGEPRTVDEYQKTLLILVGMYLDATADGVVDELDRLDAIEDLERAILGNTALTALWEATPTYTAFAYDPDREDLPLDGMHMELTFTYEETVGAPG